MPQLETEKILGFLIVLDALLTYSNVLRNIQIDFSKSNAWSCA